MMSESGADLFIGAVLSLFIISGYLLMVHDDIAQFYLKHKW